MRNPILPSANQQYCKPFLDWLHPPQMTFSQLSFHKTATFFQPIVEWIIIIIQSIFSLFLYLMGQLMWLVIKMIIYDLLTFIAFKVFIKKIMNWIDRKFAVHIFGDLIFLYLQLPLLIESWLNLGNLGFLFFILLANSGTAYYMNSHDSDRSTSNGFITLTILYLYSVGLWLIPMICFQFAVLILIVYLEVSKN